MSSTDFQFPVQCQTHIVCGPGRIEELGQLTSTLAVKRVLVVSDPGIEEAGHTRRGEAALRKSGLETETFDGFEENPTTHHVNAGLAVASEFRPDAIVAIGGGSSLDCAKGINFLYSCGGKMQDYWGVGKATGELLPMVAVPTTAGTGSEAQSFALISDAETHQKMACGDPRAAFRIAILDPELTLTQPQRVAALSGFDAISHAVDTYVTKKRNEESCHFSLKAWKRLAPNYLTVLQQPGDIAARAEMQVGACLAGLAIENSMLGAAHAMANPLTANFGITHGEAVALMLPHVVRHNAATCETWYQQLLQATADLPNCPTGGADALADFLRHIADQAGLAATLSQCGIVSSQLPQLAQEAAEQWTGKFNPVEMQRDDYLRLYERAAQ